MNNKDNCEFFGFSEGVYKVTVFVENPVSSLAVYKMLFILNSSYCDEPKVDIIADKENVS